MQSIEVVKDYATLDKFLIYKSEAMDWENGKIYQI